MARGGEGGCFPGFPASPTQLRAPGRDGDPARDSWVLRAAPAKICVACGERRWGVGRRWLSPTFFPCPFLPLPPGRGRGPAEEGEGEEGTSGENSVTRPSRPPAAYSRRPGRGGWARSATGGGTEVTPNLSFPFRIHSEGKSGHPRPPPSMNAYPGAGSARGSVASMNPVVVSIISSCHHHHHYLTGRKLPLACLKFTQSVLRLQRLASPQHTLYCFFAQHIKSAFQHPNGLNWLL